jgi:hypothetical protein
MAKQKQMVAITNISRQLIEFQVKPPAGDFFLNEQQVRLKPAEAVTVPKEYLMWHQVENLTAKRCIRWSYVTS